MDGLKAYVVFGGVLVVLVSGKYIAFCIIS